MKSLALAIIVKNAEGTIKKCLESTIGLVDGYYILDTGSTDKTTAIIETFLSEKRKIDSKFADSIVLVDKSFNVDGIFDFAGARNYNFEMVLSKHDYILWLDADDFIPEATKEILLDRLPAFESDGIMLPYYYAFDEQDQPVTVVFRERILQARTNPSWYGEVHECIDISKMALQRWDDAPIEHRPVAGQWRDISRNLKIFEKQLKQNKKLIEDGRFLYYYGKELLINGRTDEAIKLLRKKVAMKNSFYEENAAAAVLLADIYKTKTDIQSQDLAREYSFKALRFNEFHGKAMYILGELAEKEGDKEKAIYYYENCCRLPIGKAGILDAQPQFHGKMPMARLEMLYWQVGKIEGALMMAKILLEKYYPNNSGLIHDIKFFTDQLNPTKEIKAEVKKPEEKPIIAVETGGVAAENLMYLLPANNKYEIKTFKYDEEPPSETDYVVFTWPDREITNPFIQKLKDDGKIIIFYSNIQIPEDLKKVLLKTVDYVWDKTIFTMNNSPLNSQIED